MSVRAQFTFTTNNGAITITGYTGPGGNVVIPSSTNGYPVVAIGYNAFFNSAVTAVTIPDSVTSIVYSFGYCSGLTNITVAAANPSYASLGGVLFNKSITMLLQYPGGLAGTYAIPNGVTSIASSAFKYCSGLTSVTIPNSVTSIGSYAFNGCSGLTNITVDAANPSYASLGGVLFNKSITTLVQYPGSLAGTYAIPNGVTNIGTYAFWGCSGLTSATIPNSVTSIGVYAFMSCSGLTNITVAASNSNFASLGGVLFNKSITTLVQYPGGLAGTYAIPNSVTSIGRYAFEVCSSLTSVIIPNSVTSIGDYAFGYCSALHQAYFQGSAPSANGGSGSANTTVFAGDTGTAYYVSGTTGWGASFGGWPTAQWSGIPSKIVGVSGNLAFGGVPVGGNATRPLVITNSGIATLTVSNLTYPAGFSGAWTGSIPAGSAQTVTVTFAPAATQSYAGNITVASDATSGNSTLPISGTGVVPSKIIGVSGNLAFGSVPVGENATISLVITNSGNSTLTVSNLTYPDGFSGAWSGSIPAGGARTVTVTFSPATAQNYAGTITVASDATSGNSTVPISGTGYAASPPGDFIYSIINGSITIGGYIGSGGNVGIPSVINSYPVVAIGYEAFDNNSAVTAVTIPNSVTSIGGSAFDSCSALTNVVIGNSVTIIGASAFSGCSSLSSVTIPNSVINIGESAFWGCANLTNVVIGNSVTRIGYRAFQACLGLINIAVDFNNTNYASAGGVLYNKSLTTLIQFPGGLAVAGSYTIPNSVTGIGDGAFYYCLSLTNVTIPNSVTNIGYWAFYACDGLTNVTIPNNVTSIGDWAFATCSLTNVTIPNSVTSIGLGAFAGLLSLTSVTIGNSITNIGVQVFENCPGLTNIIVDAANPSYASLGGVLFNKSITTLVEYPGGLAGAYAIPNGVTSIGDDAFSSCSRLTSVTLPNSVTSIGVYAFYSCSSLTNVMFGSGVTSIGYGAFYGCSGLKSVVVPNSVTSIGGAAFASCGLTSVTIGNSVTNISGDAFGSCYRLTNFAANINNPNYATAGGVLFNKTLTTLVLYPLGLTGSSYAIPNSVTRIGDYAFEGIYRLTSMTIPNSVTNIGDWAFGNCSSLTNVTIPNSVTSIGSAAFVRCSGLTSVTIPNSVTSIGAAFQGCSGLTSVAIPNKVTTIDEMAFEGCSGLTNVVIGNGVTSIGSQAFDSCSSLTSLVVPNSITSIGGWAFVNCSGLHSVYFQGNAPNGTTGSLDTTIFQNAWAGTVFYLPGTTGWGATFGGRPTALWYQPQPQILGSGYGLGMQSNRFNFTISWATNTSVMVEASTNLQNWAAIVTNPMVSGTNYFSDTAFTNYPKRFYRVRSQ